MAHTKDTQTHYPDVAATGDNSNPVSFYLDCADDCTLVVLDINVPGGTQRTGGAPTINGYPLTQVNTGYICTEICGEKWHAVWSHFVDAGMPTPTIPGSLEILIPNAGAIRIWGVAHTYKAGLNKVSVLDVSTYKSGTTATANPSGTIFPTDANGVVTVTAGFGANAVPTSMHTAITTLYSHDPATYTFFEGYRLLSAVGSVRVMFTMASDDWGWVLASFKEADKPIIAAKWTRATSDQLSLLDSMFQATKAKRYGNEYLTPISDPFAQQAKAKRYGTDTLPSLVDTLGREAERDRSSQDVLSLLDLTAGKSASRSQDKQDTLDLTDLAGSSSRRRRSGQDATELFDGDFLGINPKETARRFQSNVPLWDTTVATTIQEITQTVIQASATDTLDLQDRTTREAQWTRIRSLWLDLTETQRQSVALWRQVLDAMDLTDVQKNWVLRLQSALDTLQLTDGDASGWWQFFVSSMQDELALLTDATASTAERVRSEQDTLLLLIDSAVRGAARMFNVTDVLQPLQDTIRQVLDRTTSALDTLVLSDTAVREYVKAVIAGLSEFQITDTLVLSDSATRWADLTRFITEWLRLSDRARTEAILEFDGDALGLTDTQAQILYRELSKLDVLFVADATTQELRLRRSAADAVLITDATQRQQAARLAQTDTLLLTDEQKRQLIRQIRLDDTLPLSDAQASHVQRQIRMLDALLVVDRVEPLRHAFRRLIDILAPLADSYIQEGETGGKTYLVQAFDVLDVIDNSGRGQSITRPIIEYLMLQDYTGAARSVLRLVADAVGLRDEQAAALLLQRKAVDWTVLSDSRARQWFHDDLVTDRLGLTDSQLQQRKLTRLELEVLTLADAISYVRTGAALLFAYTATDVLTLLDQLAVTRDRRRTMLDLLGLTDRTGPLLLTRLTQDTLELTDRLRIDRHFHIHEATELSDQLARLLVLSRVALDEVTATDASGTWADRGWSVADVLVLEDQFTRSIDIILQDSVLPTTDAVTRAMEQAFITIISGVRTTISRMIGTKLWIRNAMPRWMSTTNPFPRRTVVVDVNAAHL